MRRMFQTDWRTWIAFTFAVLTVFVVVDRERLSETNEKIAAEAVRTRVEGAKQRAELLDGQQKLQQQIDELVAQNAGLVELLESQGVEVPSYLSAGRSTTTRIQTDRDDDDDGGGDTIVVTPNSQGSSSSPPSSEPSQDAPDVDVPDVPLPPQAGQATDTAKRITEDITGININ